MKKAPNLDRNALLLFDALMETGNLSRASEKVGLSTATASRMIQSLQETFDDKLFTRWVNGMAPTRMAKELHPAVREVLGGMEELLQLKKFDPKKVVQTFRIACVDNGAFSALGPVLPTIMKKAPHLSIETLQVSDDIFTQLKAGDVDMAIFPFQEIPEGFHSQKIYSSEQCFVVGRHHPLVAILDQGTDLTQELIKPYRRIEISVSPLNHWRKFRHMENIADQEVALRTPYFLFAASMLTKTDLTMRLPATTARQLEKLGILRAFPFPQTIRTNEPLLIWHDRLHHSPLAQWIRSLIIAEHAQND